MDLNRLKELVSYNLNEDSSARKRKQAVDRIYGEVMSSLGKQGERLDVASERAIRSGIEDAYDDGVDDGYAQASNE